MDGSDGCIVLEFGPHTAGGGAGIPSLLLVNHPICMLDRPVPGEQLGNQAIFQHIVYQGSLLARELWR